MCSCCPLRACVATRPHANPSLIGLGLKVTLSAGFAMLGNMSRFGHSRHAATRASAPAFVTECLARILREKQRLYLP